MVYDLGIHSATITSTDTMQKKTTIALKKYAHFVPFIAKG